MMATATGGYSSEDRAVFSKFRQVCEDVAACRFVRDLKKQNSVFSIRANPDGSSRSEYPHYDNDDFLAFLTHFRKLAAQNEPTHIFRVINTISKRATTEEQRALKQIRDLLLKERESPWIKIEIGLPGKETTYTPKDIENIIFNGQVFHTDDSLREDLRRVLDFEPIVRMSFLRYATVLITKAWQISCVLHNRGLTERESL